MRKIYLMNACLVAACMSLATLEQQNPFMQKIAPPGATKLNLTATILPAELKREAANWTGQSFNAIIFTGQNAVTKQHIAAYLAKNKSGGLYRVDLSKVVSDNISTTKRNLLNIFESAMNKNVVLLFEESEALFGRRSRINNTHERYDSAGSAYFTRQVANHRTCIIISVKNDLAIVPVLFENYVRFIVH